MSEQHVAEQTFRVVAQPSSHFAARVLKGSVISWWLLALIGQWLFASYIAVRYGGPVLDGNYAAVNQGNHIMGYQPGATTHNLVYFSHILPAILLSICGILQLIPQIRQRWPQVHHWNGRIFMTLGISGALTGLYLTWGSGSRLSDVGAIGITLNGLLIPLAIVLAWRYAVARNFAAHRRFAVHSFLLVNGVWSFRLYLYGWFVLNQGPNGNTRYLDGTADIFFSFACYVVPMLLAELVFWGQRQPNAGRKWCVAAVVTLGALLTLIGIVAVTMATWWPVLTG
ncbi:DUF2306 domain-containing protein [Rheinheimera riviphila]|uniref:DUF2306 domain-containing protein n=1 Tax=Rheinheimera riviphila TaxID=1834037 RepID=A0A437QLJ3_9GAMM|nr:DUF2306 domain-containing protein [Rheinheimera riviphila]RVU35375.1 DUF2306 domain-containing protein [Rheinheimera riviphila]